MGLIRKTPVRGPLPLDLTGVPEGDWHKVSGYAQGLTLGLLGLADEAWTGGHHAVGQQCDWVLRQPPAIFLVEQARHERVSPLAKPAGESEVELFTLTQDLLRVFTGDRFPQYDEHVGTFMSPDHSRGASLKLLAPAARAAMARPRPLGRLVSPGQARLQRARAVRKVSPAALWAAAEQAWTPGDWESTAYNGVRLATGVELVVIPPMSGEVGQPGWVRLGLPGFMSTGTVLEAELEGDRFAAVNALVVTLRGLRGRVATPGYRVKVENDLLRRIGTVMTSWYPPLLTLSEAVEIICGERRAIDDHHEVRALAGALDRSGEPGSPGRMDLLTPGTIVQVELPSGRQAIAFVIAQIGNARDPQMKIRVIKPAATTSRRLLDEQLAELGYDLGSSEQQSLVQLVPASRLTPMCQPPLTDLHD